MPADIGNQVAQPDPQMPFSNLVTDGRIPVTMRLLLLYTVVPESLGWSSRRLGRMFGLSSTVIRVNRGRLRKRGLPSNALPDTLKLLVEISGEPDGLTVRQLATRTAISVAECQRLLGTDSMLRAIVVRRGGHLFVTPREG